MSPDACESLLEGGLEFAKAQANRAGRLQFLAALLFATTAVLWNSAFQVLTEYLPKTANLVLLPDIAHSFSDGYLGAWLPRPLIVDVLLGLLFVICFLRFLLFTSRSASLLILQRYLLLQGLVFLLRGPALYMTILPPTLTDPKDCLFISSGSVIVDTLLVVLRQKVTCTDLFFSGHSAMMVLWALLMTAHTTESTFKSRRLYQVFIAVIWAITIVALTLIPLTKFHYSIDVYIGILLAFVLQRWYYDIVSTIPHLRTVSMGLSWPQRAVMWFETGFCKLL